METKINIGDKLNLIKIDRRLSVDPERDVIQYSSQVLDEGEYNHYFVAMPIHEGKLIPFSVGQECEVTFYSKNGLFQSQAIVCGRYKNGEVFLMEIELQTILKKVQRREYFRFSCRMPMEYRIIEGDEKKIVEPGDAYAIDEGQLEWKNGIILDLSGGGARFVSAFHEEKNSLVQVRFQIVYEDHPDVVYSFARLLRSERNPNKDILYDNRIEFWRMDQGTREKIIRYIFEEQRRNRSKQLGLE